MKILFIGHYKEDSGWGLASRNYIKAFNKSGHDIVCRSIDFNPVIQPDTEIKELEEKSLDNIDVCVQHVLPHLMEKGPFEKNIGLLVYECRGFSKNPWMENIRLMDEIWSPRQDFVFELPGLKYLPHAFDLSKYNKMYFHSLKEIPDSYTFYTIGEWTNRKRNQVIINAFMRAFDHDDNVSLIIKTNRSGTDYRQLQSEIESQIKQFSEILDKKEYPPIYVITERLNETDLNGLHVLGDCFVSASRGEGWCIPAFDAIGFKNATILPNSSPFIQYSNCRLIKTNEDYVLKGDSVVPGYYTPKETWDNINTLSLVKAMKEQYAVGKQRIHADISKYSYKEVGKLIEGYLK